jgi:hypothetical protein
VAAVLASHQKLDKCRWLRRDPFSSRLRQALQAKSLPKPNDLSKDGKILPTYSIAHGSFVANMLVSAQKRACSETING